MMSDGVHVADLDIDPELLAQLASERVLRRLTELDLAAGELPPIC